MTSRRILIRGNCHAQYLGAALKATTNHEVRVAGLPYDGPIHFGGATADYTDLNQGLRWIREAKERPIFIVQATPGKHYLSEKWISMGIEHDLVKVPFLRFGAFELSNLPGTDEAAKSIRLEVRKDRIFNEMGAIAAGRDASDIDYVMEAFRAEPAFYSHSHYTGEVFARLFSLMRGSALDESLGAGGFDAFLSAVRQDAGVGHLMRPLPDPRVMAAMGMTWTAEDLSAQVIAAGQRNGMKIQLPDNGVVAYALFDRKFKAYHATKNIADLLTCVQLYKADKFYLRWAGNIVGALMTRGKLMHAAIVLFHRLAFDDSRGRTLGIALPHLQKLSGSAAARRIADRYAEAYPDSSAVFAREIMQKFL
ncbi:hypothetical protein ACIQTU_02665 [Brevundimonas sp. NPDC090276]|uniref:hypothetical protein n=1 Tax=Brevundimonas sp. NPDC090276 TaxID=3363956 RepID=UPI003839DED4